MTGETGKSDTWLLVSDIDDTLTGSRADLERLWHQLKNAKSHLKLALNSSRPAASVDQTLADYFPKASNRTRSSPVWEPKSVWTVSFWKAGKAGLSTGLTRKFAKSSENWGMMRTTTSSRRTERRASPFREKTAWTRFLPHSGTRASRSGTSIQGPVIWTFSPRRRQGRCHAPSGKPSWHSDGANDRRR